MSFGQIIIFCKESPFLIGRLRSALGGKNDPPRYLKSPFLIGRLRRFKWAIHVEI